MASHSYTTCYTYNISTTNTNITRDDLQNAFQIGVISPAGIAYRWTFGCVYLVVLGWSSWQYGVHGLNKKLWLDNRQIVVLCISLCALLRALQFLLKAVTDCQNEYKWIDELFTALGTIVQFTGFTLLISFWIELQLNVRQGLKSLQKLKRPTIILLVVFFCVRMLECIFIILAKSTVYTEATSSTFKLLANIFRGLNVSLYGVVLVIATYWGYKLLQQLRAFERKTRETNKKTALAIAKRELKKEQLEEEKKAAAAGGAGAGGAGAAGGAAAMGGGAAATGGGGGGGGNGGGGYDSEKLKVSESKSSKLGTSSSLARQSSSTSFSGVSEAAMAKQKLFHDKVLRMTLFMFLEIVTYVVWLGLYGVLYTMRRGNGSNISAKISEPRTYLSIKFVEKFCEWLTIVVLCFTMVASSQSRKARQATIGASVMKLTHSAVGNAVGRGSSAIKKIAGRLRRSSRTSSRASSSGANNHSNASSIVSMGGATGSISLAAVDELDNGEESFSELEPRLRVDTVDIVVGGEMNVDARNRLREVQEGGSRTSSLHHPKQHSKSVVSVVNPLEDQQSLKTSLRFE